MIFFFSELYAYKDSCLPFFEFLFNGAKSGSQFLFIDNRNRMFYGWFDKIIEKYGIKTCKSGEGTIQIGDLAEEKSDLGVYYEKFGSPKLRSEIAYRICEKA